MPRRDPTASFVAVALASVVAAGPFAVADAQTIPREANAQLEFLRTAKVIDTKPIGKGITGALRVSLSDGRLAHDASFQSIDDRSSLEDLRQGRLRAGERLFVDSYRYNIAAYQLATLLGLGHMMPATVERSIEGRRGALSWWIDDVLMDEEEREKRGEQSPNPLRLNQKRQRMFVFAELVYDTDRNKGNVLYTKSWEVMMIDFSRAFRLHDTLRVPAGIETCDRALFGRLQSLTAAQLEEATGEWLNDRERDALLKRRDLIVERVRGLVNARGEARVLY